MFTKDLRGSIRFEAIIKDQMQGWQKLRDTHPSMGYLFDEYTNHKRDVIVESIDDFRQLTFDIVRSMQKACGIAVKLGYSCATKQVTKTKGSNLQQSSSSSSNRSFKD